MNSRGEPIEITPIVVASAADLADRAAEWTVEHVKAAVAERGACYLALSGGETPRGCYERLGRPPYQEAVPWGQVHLYWSDERQVLLDDPASNYAMAKSALLDRVPVSADQIHPLVGDPRSALEDVPRDAAGLPRFDLIHLGMGEDGHTASLFPGHPALESQAPVVRVLDSPKPPPERLTFSLAALNAARAVLFMVHGAAKREALARVLRRDPTLPASLIQPSAGELVFIVDRAAFPV